MASKAKDKDGSRTAKSKTTILDRLKSGDKKPGPKAKPPKSFMDEQAEQDEQDSVSEQLGKHVSKIWEIVREAELWTRAARNTSSAPMKVGVAERVKKLAKDLGDECGDLMKFAKKRGLDQ